MAHSCSYILCLLWFGLFFRVFFVLVVIVVHIFDSLKNMFNYVTTDINIFWFETSRFAPQKSDKLPHFIFIFLYKNTCNNSDSSGYHNGILLVGKGFELLWKLIMWDLGVFHKYYAEILFCLFCHIFSFFSRLFISFMCFFFLFNSSK